MFNKSKFKKVISITLTSLMLLGSVGTCFANEEIGVGDMYASEAIEIFAEAEPFNPSEMTYEQRDAYYDSIDKQVELYKEKYNNNCDEDKFREELIYVLENEDSLKSLSSLEESTDNKIVKRSAGKKDKKKDKDGTWIPDVKVKNDVVAAAIGVIIDGVLVATGVGSVTALVKKVGLKEARRIFTKSIKSKLIAWGAGALAVSIPTAVDFIFNLMDPSDKIAEFFDSKDDFPNNGYLDLVL